VTTTKYEGRRNRQELFGLQGEKGIPVAHLLALESVNADAFVNEQGTRFERSLERRREN
jgi:hypothetical protein